LRWRRATNQFRVLRMACFGNGIVRRFSRGFARMTPIISFQIRVIRVNPRLNLLTSRKVAKTQSNR
jgi:hypothetical protein